VEATDIAEHIHEPHHPEHHPAPGHDGFRKFAGIYLGIVAMLLAIASLGGGAATKEMLSANIHASDTYAQYQAKYLRQVDLQNAAEILEAIAGLSGSASGVDRTKLTALVQHYRDTAALYESEPATGNGKRELLAKAKIWEGRRDYAARQDPNFELAEALLQIAIVLGSVSIVAESRWLIGLSAILASCGVVMTVCGFLFPITLSAQG